MLCLVCYIAAKVSANNAVPSWVVFLVKFLLYIRCNVLFYVVLLHCLRGTVNGILLHVLGHVCILDDSLSVRHGEPSPHFCKNATTNRHRDFTIPFLHPPPLQNLHKTEHKVVSSQFILHLFFKKNPLTKCMWFTAGKKKCTPINKVDKAP